MAQERRRLVVRRDIDVGDLVSYRKNPDDKGFHVGIASSIICDESAKHAHIIIVKLLTPVRGAGTNLIDSSWSKISGEVISTSEENLVDGVHIEEPAWELCSARFVKSVLPRYVSRFQLPEDAQGFVKAAVTAYAIRMKQNGVSFDKHTIPVFKSRPMQVKHAELRTVIQLGDRVIYQPWEKKGSSYNEVGLVSKIESDKGEVRYLSLQRYLPTRNLPGHYTLATTRIAPFDYPQYSPSFVKIQPFFLVGILDQFKINVDIESDLK